MSFGIAGNGSIIRLGVIDKDDGIGHICLHQPLGQKQGDDTEDKCTPLHKAAGQDRMHCFSFGSDQPQQADHCGGHHTQKRAVLTGESRDAKPAKKVAAVKAVSAPAPVAKTEEKGGMSKLKSWVKNAVNCCIE